MQAVIVEFPSRESLSVTRLPNDRLQSAEDQVRAIDRSVSRLNERVGTIERNVSTILENVKLLQQAAAKPRSGPSPWITGVVFPLLTLIATLWTLSYNSRKVDKLNGSINGVNGLTLRLGRLETRQGKLESSLRLLTATVAPHLQHEIDESLKDSARAVAQGNIDAATADLNRVSTQAKALREAQVGAEQPFFSRAATTLMEISAKNPRIASAAWESLAAYHSSVIQPGDLATIFAPGSAQAVSVKDLENLPRDRDSYFKGFRVYRFEATPFPFPRGLNVIGDRAEIIINLGKGDWLSPVNQGPLGQQRKIKGIVAVTASQTLDDIEWEDVVLVDSHVSYHGGALALKNVRFVNCTFDVTTDRGRQVLNYAMTNQPELLISGDKSLHVGV